MVEPISVAKRHNRPLLHRNYILLVYLPAINVCLASFILQTAGVFEWALIPHLMLRMWVASTLCLAFAMTIEKVFSQDDRLEYSLSPKLLGKYFISAFTALLATGHLFEPPDALLPGHNGAPGGPLLMVSLELLIALTIRQLLVKAVLHRDLESNYKSLQFSMLKAKLNPHFLFNTLNLISAEIEDNPKLATKLVDELSELLRGILTNSSTTLTTVREEISLLENYLYLQKIRFEDRLTYTLNSTPEAESLLVPSLIVQPIAENCFVHGVANKTEAGVIDIAIKKVNEKVCISVKDNGSGANTINSSLENSGHGLAIVKDTLALLYGDNHQITVTGRTDKKPGVETYIELPVRHDND